MSNSVVYLYSLCANRVTVSLMLRKENHLQLQNGLLWATWPNLEKAFLPLNSLVVWVIRSSKLSNSVPTLIITQIPGTPLYKCAFSCLPWLTYKNSVKHISHVSLLTLHTRMLREISDKLKWSTSAFRSRSGYDAVKHDIKIPLIYL